MAQYEIKFKIWGEYPSSYEGVCKVELSDDEVQQLVALMQEYNTSDAEELELEDNLPEIYEKICDACEDVAMEIVEKDWLDSSIWHLGDSDYDEEELISHCQWKYGCPDFDDEDDDEFDDEEEGKNDSEEKQYQYFDDWLRDFWKTATREEQEDLLFNYMGFDEFELSEARCGVREQYEIAIPQAIVEMVDIKNEDKPVFCNLTFEERNGEFFFYADGQPYMISKKQWMSTKSKELAEMIIQDSRNPEIHNTGRSILTFHYNNYVKSVDEYLDTAYMCNILVPCDPFLAFHKPDQDEYDYSWELYHKFRQIAHHRLISYSVIHDIYRSFAIADHIVEKIIESDGSYEEKKEQFLNDIEEYVAKTCTTNPITRNKLSVIIDKFVFYYQLEEV